MPPFCCDFSQVSTPGEFLNPQSLLGSCVRRNCLLLWVLCSKITVTQRPLLFPLENTFSSYSIFTTYRISTLPTSQITPRMTYRDSLRGPIEMFDQVVYLKECFYFTWENKTWIAESAEHGDLPQGKYPTTKSRGDLFLRLCCWQLCKYHPPKAGSLETER